MPRTFTPFRTIAFWFTAAYVFLVHCQLGPAEGAYASDLGLHLGYVTHPGGGEAAGYSLLHTLCGLLVAPLHLPAASYGSAAAGAMMVLLAGAFYHSLTLVHGCWRSSYPARGDGLVSGLTLAVFVVSMLILLPLLRTYYLGVFTGNPWHNPTYPFARVFALVSFIGFLRLTSPDRTADGGRGGWLVAFAAASALSVWAKPTFMLSLGPAYGVLLLFGGWRGRLRWPEVSAIGGALLPAAATLVVLDHTIYAAPGTESSVVFSPGEGWGMYTPSFAMSIALAAAFPLFVLIVRCRRLTRTMTLATVNWLIATLAFLLLAERGPRATHANFAWCYMGGLFFFFLGAVEEWFLAERPNRRWVWIAGTLLFAAHLVSGVYYFAVILAGGAYM